MKRIVCIGGWGHWPEVFQCLEKRTDVQMCGIAPAYEGEDLEGICSKEIMKNVPLFGNSDEMLQSSADFCIVSTRPGHIVAANIKAAQAGLDIISEKPIGITLDELNAVETAVKQNGVRLMAMLTMRSFPVFQAAEKLFKDGAIGALALVNARKSYKYGNRPEWFGDRNVYGGTFPWVGIHSRHDSVYYRTATDVCLCPSGQSSSCGSPGLRRCLLRYICSGWRRNGKC